MQLVRWIGGVGVNAPWEMRALMRTCPTSVRVRGGGAVRNEVLALFLEREEGGRWMSGNRGMRLGGVRKRARTVVQERVEWGGETGGMQGCCDRSWWQ